MLQLKTKERLVNLLLKEEIISKDDLNKAMEHQWEKGGEIEKSLIQCESLGEMELVKIFVRILGFPLYNPDSIVDKRPLALVSRGTAKKYSLIPIKSNNKYIIIAMANPIDKEAISTVEDETGLKVIAMVAPKSEIDNTVIKHYRLFSIGSE
ncbi:hypothetical protein KAX02_05885 [candidate division WOR-3 bacterium]|nr:hypothetical protein [candidate division WOR-3 bacterium]